MFRLSEKWSTFFFWHTRLRDRQSWCILAWVTSKLNPLEASRYGDYSDCFVSTLTKGLAASFVKRDAELNFFIEYEFKSRMLGAVMGAMFDRAFRMFSEAFERRADVVYGVSA